MKNLFEYLISVTLVALLIVFIYTSFRTQLVDVAKKTFAPIESVNTRRERR